MKEELLEKLRNAINVLHKSEELEKQQRNCSPDALESMKNNGCLMKLLVIVVSVYAVPFIFFSILGICIPDIVLQLTEEEKQGVEVMCCPAN